MVAGDQETFSLVHKAIAKYPTKYEWVVPWIGDWHLLEHTLDVLFRKWGGFAILHLSKASGCYDRKLEGKSYHKRHFVLLAVLEALWRACGSEVASASGRGDPLSGEELLKELQSYVGTNRHSTFGQWVEFLLVDGMAYLALYTGIRVGDFELREAAIRSVAPLFLGYNKNLYHTLCIQHLADIARMLPNERAFAHEIFSLSLAGRVGKNVGLDEIQEMMMNKDIKSTANRPDAEYIKLMALRLQVEAGVGSGFENAFDSGLQRKRDVYASIHRQRTVDKMADELLSQKSPFKLSSGEGRAKTIAADGRVAFEDLERAMLSSRQTSENMWRVGVAAQFPELRRHGAEGGKMRKRVQLDTFTTEPTKKKPKTRAQGVQDRQIDDLKKIVETLAKEGNRKDDAPIMVSGMPAQMGSFAGHLHVISKFGPGAMRTAPPRDLDVPHTCAIDMATIIHQVGPKQRIDSSSWRRLHTWRQYAAYVVERLVWGTCSREGTLKGEVILCFDKREHVPPVKAFAHAVRFNIGDEATGARSGAKGKRRVTHKLRTKKKAPTTVAPLWSRARRSFHLDDETPPAEGWHDLLSDRQNRDNIFGVICKYIREQVAVIAQAAECSDGSHELSFAQLHISEVKLRVDGEPEISADYSRTVGYRSWSTYNNGVIINEAGNGIGEGELQALHHLWDVGRRPGRTDGSKLRVEVMSVDTDEWMAALLVYAVHPSTRSVRVVVRQQRGVGDEPVQHIDVLELFEHLINLSHWPHHFSPLQRCLPVVVAYVLCGTDFTPTLHSLTSPSMFQVYYDYLSNATNAGFVKPLGSARDDGGGEEGLDLNVKECIKFAGLCYFRKNSKYFKNALPGQQVEDSRRVGRPDDVEAWISVLHERTQHAHFAKAQWQDVVPEYDVLELHVKRVGWVVEYWLSTYRKRGQYPICVPEWNGAGYIRDEDGVALMHLRRSPWVTLRPGEGIRVVSCNCSPNKAKGKCSSCVCAKQVGGACSPLCKCSLVCGKGTPTREHAQVTGRAKRVTNRSARQAGGAGGGLTSFLEESSAGSSDDDSEDGHGDASTLDAFADQFQDASGFVGEDEEEYMHDLLAEAQAEASDLQLTSQDVTRGYSERCV